MLPNTDVVIIGAGAAGLMCAIEAGKRGRKVLVIEKTNKPGKKILMSGGGRCNFTNYNIEPQKYISKNKHFCKSALKQYTQWDFINLVEQYNIPYYEKTLGQLFCKNKSKDIVNMLLAECLKYSVDIILNSTVENVCPKNNHYSVLISTDDNQTNNRQKILINTTSLVIASGGLSIPTLGSSSFGYDIAKQFGLIVNPTRAGLVPFILPQKSLAKYLPLSGVSTDCSINCNNIAFREGILFTHKGLSGPSVLQISSYWGYNDYISINLLPDIDLYNYLLDLKTHKPDYHNKQLITILSQFLPKNLIKIFLQNCNISAEKLLKQLDHKEIQKISDIFNNWQEIPTDTEGYKTAEVTLGGVDVDQLSSKTMECKQHPGLYFIGEVVDVTGWLGGYNFQWAWSSGWVAGQYV